MRRRPGIGVPFNAPIEPYTGSRLGSCWTPSSSGLSRRFGELRSSRPHVVVEIQGADRGHKDSDNPER